MNNNSHQKLITFTLGQLFLNIHSSSEVTSRPDGLVRKSFFTIGHNDVTAFNVSLSPRLSHCRLSRERLPEAIQMLKKLRATVTRM